MLGTHTFLALYYLGFGFVIFLLWATVTDASTLAGPPARRRRLHHLALGLAVAGVLHPAFALAGRDIAAQLGRPDGPYDVRAAGTLRRTTWALAVALGVLLLVGASQLGAFEGLPVLRHIRRRLPFA